MNEQQRQPREDEDENRQRELLRPAEASAPPATAVAMTTSTDDDIAADDHSAVAAVDSEEPQTVTPTSAPTSPAPSGAATTTAAAAAEGEPRQTGHHHQQQQQAQEQQRLQQREATNEREDQDGDGDDSAAIVATSPLAPTTTTEIVEPAVDDGCSADNVAIAAASTAEEEESSAGQQEEEAVPAPPRPLASSTPSPAAWEIVEELLKRDNRPDPTAAGARCEPSLSLPMPLLALRNSTCGGSSGSDDGATAAGTGRTSDAANNVPQENPAEDVAADFNSKRGAKSASGGGDPASDRVDGSDDDDETLPKDDKTAELTIASSHPPELRRTSDTPGAFHEGGRRSASGAGAFYGGGGDDGDDNYDEPSSSSLRPPPPSLLRQNPSSDGSAVPSETDPAARVDSVAMSTLSGENMTLVSATLVGEEEDEEDSESNDNGGDRGNQGLVAEVSKEFVIAHAQPVRRRRALCLSGALFLCAIGIVVGVTIAVTGRQPPPADDGTSGKFSDLDQRLASSTYQSLYAASWGTATLCDDFEPPPLRLSCGQGSSTALLVLLDDLTDKNRVPLCQRRDYSIIECRSLPYEGSRVAESERDSESLSSFYSSRTILFTCAGTLLEDLTADAITEKSIAAGCGNNFLSTERVDFYGGATFSYLSVDQICQAGEGDPSSQWQVRGTQSCEEGDEWKSENGEMGDETPFRCSSSQACVADQACRRGDPECNGISCEELVGSLHVTNLPDPETTVDQCTLPVSWAPTPTDSSTLLSMARERAPSRTDLHRPLESLLEGESSIGADNAAIVTAYNFHTSYGIAWGSHESSCTNIPNSPNITVQCGGADDDGVISLSTSSSDVTCRRETDYRIQCWSEQLNPSSIGIVCGGNTDQDMIATTNLPTTTARSCNERLYTIRTSYEDQERTYGGAAGSFVNMGQFCFDDGNRNWSLQSDISNCGRTNDGKEVCSSVGSCTAIVNCKVGEETECTGNWACNADVAAITSSSTGTSLCSRNTSDSEAVAPPVLDQRNQLLPLLEDAGTEALQFNVDNEMKLISVKPPEPEWTVPPDGREPGRTLDPVAVPDIETAGTAVPTSSPIDDNVGERNLRKRRFL